MTSPLPPMLAIVAAVFRFRVVGIPEPLKKKKILNVTGSSWAGGTGITQWIIASSGGSKLQW